MVVQWLFFLFVMVNGFESPRVSRIKPTFYNYQPDGHSRYQTTTSTPSFENTEVDFNRHHTTLHAIMKTYQTTVGPMVQTQLCEKPYSCINCTNYRVCAPTVQGMLELYSGSCPVDRPYCDDYSGTCVNSPETALRCGTPDQSFHCMQDGYFPHTEDPSKYFICSNLIAFTYSCREGYKYYAQSQECSKFSWISHPFDCTELNATKVIYKNGGSFFAYCVNGKPYTVSKCPENEFFNVTSQVCEPECSEEMVIPDNNNCLKYFQCFKSNSTNLYEKISLRCPSGEGFSKDLNKCVSAMHLKDCKLTA